MSRIAYHTRGFAYAAGVRFVYNETKPQPRIWRSATEASDHLTILETRGADRHYA